MATFQFCHPDPRRFPDGEKDLDRARSHSDPHLSGEESASLYYRPRCHPDLALYAMAPKALTSSPDKERRSTTRLVEDSQDDRTGILSSRRAKGISGKVGIWMTIEKLFFRGLGLMNAHVTHRETH